LLIFAAYLMLVATCVLLFSGNPVIWSGVEMGSWDTEGVVAKGLVILGGAIIASRTVAGVARCRVLSVGLAPVTS
jgi:hypothetical protein